MPHVSLKINGDGPLIKCHIGVSHPRRDALLAAGQNVPPPVQITALIDTGASSSSIDPSILRQLNLPLKGQVPIHTPSTDVNSPHIANLYDVSITFSHRLGTSSVTALEVIESCLDHQGIQALIGRDVLAYCLFTYDGVAQNFCLAL